MSHAEIAPLCADREIKYEMRCRGIRPEDYTIGGRIEWWKAQLKKEAKDKIDVMKIESYLEPKVDLEEADKWFADLSQEAVVDDSEDLEKVCVRLNFLEQRVRRVQVVSHTEEAVLRELLLTGIADLNTHLELRQYELWRGHAGERKNSRSTVNPNVSADVNQLTMEEQGALQAKRNGREANIKTHERDPDVENRSDDEEMSKSLLVSGSFRCNRSCIQAPPQLYKWPIKFSGDNSRDRHFRRISITLVST